LYKPLALLSPRQNSSLLNLFSSVNIGLTEDECDRKIFSDRMRRWMVPHEIARAPCKSQTVLLCCKGISLIAWATSARIYLSPWPQDFFPDVTSHSPFKAVSCDACHSFHSLETVCLVTENSIAATPKIPRGSTPFTRCFKR
jgi:hypothetical protein